MKAANDTTAPNDNDAAYLRLMERMRERDEATIRSQFHPVTCALVKLSASMRGQV